MTDCAVESRPSNHSFTSNRFSDKIKIPCRQDFLSKSQDDFVSCFQRAVSGPNIRDALHSKILLKDDQCELRTAAYPQIIQTIINSAIEWEEDYSSKKNYLSSMVRTLMLSQIAQKIVFYILVPVGSPNDTLDFLAHCIVYEREACIKKGKDSSQLELAPIWTISYVFVPTKNRGFGNGKKLLRALQKYMSAENISLSILYSDIGTDFYSKIQWNPVLNTEWIYRIQQNETFFNPPLSPPKMPEKQYITIPVNLYTMENVIKRYREELLKEMMVTKSKNPSFSIIPTVENLECDYLDMLSKYSAKHHISLQSAALSVICGAIIYPNTVYKREEVSYVLWSMDASLHTFLVTRLYVSSQSCFEFIMSDLIISVARYYGMKEIIIWDQSCPSSFSHLMPLLGYHNRPLDERIPCIYYQEKNQNSPNPIWLHNEPFFWL